MRKLAGMLYRLFVGLTLSSLPFGMLVADFQDPNADRDALPTVPTGFEVSFFAREPLVRQPCSMAFDAKGRLCVGMGPEYRNPKPETPGDMQPCAAHRSANSCFSGEWLVALMSGKSIERV